MHIRKKVIITSIHPVVSLVAEAVIPGEDEAGFTNEPQVSGSRSHNQRSGTDSFGHEHSSSRNVLIERPEAEVRGVADIKQIDGSVRKLQFHPVREQQSSICHTDKKRFRPSQISGVTIPGRRNANLDSFPSDIFIRKQPKGLQSLKKRSENQIELPLLNDIPTSILSNTRLFDSIENPRLIQHEDRRDRQPTIWVEMANGKAKEYATEYRKLLKEKRNVGIKQKKEYKNQEIDKFNMRQNYEFNKSQIHQPEAFYKNINSKIFLNFIKL